MDTFERARELKATALQSVSILQSAPTSIREPPLSVTPEDALIATLRAHGKSWGDITARLNSGRLMNDGSPNWTEAAVYSRFILNGSETATPANEVGFEPRDYSHIKNAGSA